MNELKALAARTRVTHCLDCGKCTPVCPVAQRQPGFSPRRLIEAVLGGDGAPLLGDCIGCARCEVRCPSLVRFAPFVRDARALVRLNGHGGRAHGGFFVLPAAWSREPVPEPEWLSDDLRVRETSEVLVFTGCAPLFDRYFHHLELDTTAASRATIRILNHLGVEPAVLAEESCCGHDQLWSGDVETFRVMAERVVERIRATGAETVLTPCAECARCLGLDYPEQLGELPFAVRHVLSWLVDQELELGPVEGAVTFHDPCRLARHLEDTASPRELLERIPELELVEMPHSGRDGTCCGTEGFTRCGAVNKGIQAARLEEAHATGAQMMLTACPKCRVHFACAAQDPDTTSPMPIRDLTELVAASMMEESA